MSRLVFVVLISLLPMAGYAQKMWSYAEAVKAGYHERAE